MPSFELISPDGRPVTVAQPALAVRLRAQGYRDAEPEVSATEPLGEQPDLYHEGGFLPDARQVVVGEDGDEHVFVELADSAEAVDN